MPTILYKRKNKQVLLQRQQRFVSAIRVSLDTIDIIVFFTHSYFNFYYHYHQSMWDLGGYGFIIFLYIVYIRINIPQSPSTYESITNTPQSHYSFCDKRDDATQIASEIPRKYIRKKEKHWPLKKTVPGIISVTLILASNEKVMGWMSRTYLKSEDFSPTSCWC